MVRKEVAVRVKERSLNAITELSKALFEIQHQTGEEEFEVIKRGVGLSIGRIQMEILEHIYAQYPELDHLNENMHDTE